MTTTSGTVTIALADLDLALRASIPFAEPDVGAAEYAIQLTAGGGRLTAAATDRYVAARVRRPATGRLDTPFLLCRSHAELLRQAIAFHLDVRSAMPITVTVTDDWPYRTLQVGITGDFTCRFYNAPWRVANIDAALAGTGTGTGTGEVRPPTGEQMRRYAGRIKPFLQVAALVPGDTLRWTRHGGEGQTALIQIGDWFTGALMPARPAVER